MGIEISWIGSTIQEGIDLRWRQEWIIVEVVKARWEWRSNSRNSKEWIASRGPNLELLKEEKPELTKT
ncbi:hypothetical protein PGTUg99_023984 [Puccinia graminis f. sp. tritici]|uniref:Uncharacterized protein n=1 Tax=Puccinia graminis f. sp. tritici TaxID=56615 RepID=A0A5B0Q1G4_PUCGR|nr:hypothetical protein PGTUg99_023984 [Puccinia graminis f. sp. tritici]